MEDLGRNNMTFFVYSISRIYLRRNDIALASTAPSFPPLPRDATPRRHFTTLP